MYTAKFLGLARARVGRRRSDDDFFLSLSVEVMQKCRKKGLFRGAVARSTGVFHFIINQFSACRIQMYPWYCTGVLV